MSVVLEVRRPTSEVALCRLDDLPVGLGHSFHVGVHHVAVFRTRSGDVHAVDGTCPHRGAPLADGILAAGQVVCPFHAMKFNLTTGECDRPDTCAAVNVYPTRVHDGWVYLTLPAQS